MRYIVDANIIVGYRSQSMDNKIICVNSACKAELKRPQTPFIKCPSCRTDFFVFCHEFPFKLFEHIQCKKCPNELYYFFCFKCTGLMNFVKYRMGSISSCKCGFQGCYVVCNQCKKPECFPPDRRYEGIAWKCSYCKNPFNFMTCDQCFHQIYDQNFAAGQNLTCKNKACLAYLTVKSCEGCKFIFIDSRGRNRCEPCFDDFAKNNPQMAQLPQPAIEAPSSGPQLKSKTSQKKEKEAGTKQPSGVGGSGSKVVPENLQCKVCLDKEADYINTKCFHLSVCEVCVRSMKNVCPLCRGEGEFRKVFK